ncbi:MAG: replication-relaxation family protein [Gemmatimonadaceae bacterium]
MTAPQVRRSRFKREETKDIKLNDRDLLILRAVHHHRFLRSTHLIALTGSPEKPLLRRLHLLYHNGFLDRPRVQIDYYHRGGSKPMVYALGDRGADVLSERDGISRGKFRWSQKNLEVGRPFLEHTLAVADFMIALELACQQHGRIEFIPAEQVLTNAPAVTRARVLRNKEPFSWHVPLMHNGERHSVGIIPDGVFGLRYLDRPEGRNRAFFFLEMDLSTMSVAAKSLRKSSILKKLLAYHASWLQGLHEKHFGVPNCRTLFVTTSHERVQNFIAAAKTVVLAKPGTRTGKTFLFTEHDNISPNTFFTLGWQNAIDEEPVTLGL